MAKVPKEIKVKLDDAQMKKIFSKIEKEALNIKSEIRAHVEVLENHRRDFGSIMEITYENFVTKMIEIAAE